MLTALFVCVLLQLSYF